MPEILNLKKRITIESRPQTAVKVPPDNRLAWDANLQNATHGRRILWLLALILLMGILFFQFDESKLLLTLIIISIVFILAARLKTPQSSRIEIGGAGIKINDTTHHWKDIHSFWLEYNPGSIQELSLQMKKPFLPRLAIPLAGQDPMRIRGELIAYIPEEEHELSPIDALLKH